MIDGNLNFIQRRIVIYILNFTKGKNIKYKKINLFTQVSIFIGTRAEQKSNFQYLYSAHPSENQKPKRKSKLYGLYSCAGGERNKGKRVQREKH